MKIISTNIGARKEIDWKGTLITTGIFKFPVDTPIFLDFEDVKGDEISDRENHGGILQATYVYSVKHYDHFKPLYPNLEWQLGMFGENLTMDDLDETKIHVGDTFKVGNAIIEATLHFLIVMTNMLKIQILVLLKIKLLDHIQQMINNTVKQDILTYKYQTNLKIQRSLKTK